MSAGISRYFLLFCVALLIGVAILHVNATRNARPAVFMGGKEARLLQDLVLPPETVAVIPADRIGKGDVLDIEEQNGITYVLHSEQWLRVDADGIHGPYGTGAEGAPGVFDNAADLIPADTLIYVLDRRPARIITFRPNGSYVTAIPVKSGDTATIYIHPERFTRSNNEFQVLLTHFNPTGRIHRELVTGAGEWSRLYWLDADSLQHMMDDVLLAANDSAVTLLTMLGYRLHNIRGSNVRVTRRADPPHYSIPDSIRWDFERTFAKAPSAVREQLSLPEFIPLVRAFSLLDESHFAVAISRDMEAISIEVLDANAVPLWRSPEVFDAPVFMHGDRFFRVEEQPNHLVVLRHRIKRAAEWPK